MTHLAWQRRSPVSLSLFALVLGGAGGGCGLISSDITTLKFDLPERMYSFDTAQTGATLPAATLIEIPCTDTASCCALATAAMPGADCGLVTCDAASATCALTGTIETAPQVIDLKSQVSGLQGRSSQSALDVTISKITYDITRNTMNVDLPAIELFVAANGATSTADPTAKRFGVLRPTPAGAVVTGGDVVLDPAGQAAFVDFAHQFGTPFVFLGRTKIVIPGGTPLPRGAVDVTIKGQLKAKVGL